MMCLKSVLIFLVLLPFPTAPPLFMLLFVTAMVHKLRPCVYCSVVLVLAFLATCNNEFLSLSFPLQSPNGTTIISLPPRTFFPPSSNTSTPHSSPPTYNITAFPSLLSINPTELLYSAPARRCWCDLNSGRFLWPNLRGYELIDKTRAQRWKLRLEERRLEEEEAKRSQAESEGIKGERDQMTGSGSSLKTANSSSDGEAHLPDLPWANQPDPIGAGLEPESHVWIPLEPDDDDPINDRASRTTAPDPRVEQEVSLGTSSEETRLPHATAMATSTRTGSLRKLMPWFFTAPRGGRQQQAVSDSTVAPPPETPQAPSDLDLEIPALPLIESISAESDPPAPSIFPSTPFPSRWFHLLLPTSTRYDLRYNGIGLVLDFGLGRSEEAVKSEVEEWIAWDVEREERWEEGRRRRRGPKTVSGMGATIERVTKESASEDAEETMSTEIMQGQKQGAPQLDPETEGRTGFFLRLWKRLKEAPVSEKGRSADAESPQ